MKMRIQMMIPEEILQRIMEGKDKHKTMQQTLQDLLILGLKERERRKK